MRIGEKESLKIAFQASSGLKQGGLLSLAICTHFPDIGSIFGSATLEPSLIV